MPAGVSWPTYLKYSLAAGLSMIAGAQTVHRFYRPLEDLEEWVTRFEEQKKLIEEVKGTENQVKSEPTVSAEISAPETVTAQVPAPETS